MASLKEVRGRIQSVNSTQQITKAMKMVAAAKLRRAQENIIQMRPYSQKLSAIIKNVSAGLDESELDNPYAKERAPERILIVAISSDRGLCGAFNTNVFRAINIMVAEQYSAQAAKGHVTILPVGRKAFDFSKRRGLPNVTEYSSLFSAPSYDNVKKVAEYAMQEFLSHHYDRVILVYNEFKNVATQIIRKEQFLPIAPAQTEDTSNVKVDYIFEPSKEEIFKDLIPETLKIQFYKAVLESSASEQGARMTAMDKATENAGELIKELKLTYNRTRQAAITKEILEIVGGAEALAAK
ncbi:MAG TPA: ATP synthase F1 subunit gamma [Cytophagales bacterium]|nr:ATP synthase F1 subunit gamma [Cytophagales bacterium]